MNTLANRINAVRLELGLSKSDVWKGAGLSSGAYTHWMNGGALKGENLICESDLARNGERAT
jgi:hypothetical protein